MSCAEMGAEVVGGGRRPVGGGAGARRGLCLRGQGARQRGQSTGCPCAWRSAAQTAMQWWCSWLRQPASHVTKLSPSTMHMRHIGHWESSSLWWNASLYTSIHLRGTCYTPRTHDYTPDILVTSQKHLNICQIQHIYFSYTPRQA